MVPRTFPSTYSSSGQQQMVVYFLPSVQNLKRWSDYIPVKLSTGGKENSYDNNGFISIAVTTQVAGRVAFKDYVPVYVDNAATDAWKINSVGYIPYGYSGTGDATLVLDFLNASTLDSKITFTRASSGTYFDATGTLQTATTNNARFDYNPSTLAARGMLVEEQRTNSIRNNTMQGAVAGTPGTMPTNWFTFTVVTGLTRQIVGTGTENGITYIEIKLSGTPSAAGVYQVIFDGQNNIAALTGQTWSQSVYIKLQAGTYTGISSTRLGFNEYSSVPAYVTGNSVTVTAATNSALATQRQTGAQVLNGGATTAFVQPYLELALSGAAIDITLRIGLPQLEQGAFATSVISTTTAAATRSADVASVNTLSPWYNSSAGTLYAEFSSPVPNSVSVAAVIVGFDDGTANNRFSNFYTIGSGVSTVAANQLIGGSVSFGGNQISAASGVTLSNVQKLATRFQAANYAASSNGNAVVTDAFSLSPPSVNTLRIGIRPSGTQANLWLRRVIYYPRGLTNAALQSLTA